MSTIELTSDMIGTADMRRIYALTVKGGTGALMLIADDDMVIVRRTNDVADGEMYVLRWNTSEETAIRRVFDLGLSYELRTETGALTRIVPHNEVEIMGQVIAVIRHVEGGQS